MKKYIVLICASVLLFSCSLDENKSPNNVLADQMTPELRLSAAQTSAYAPLAGDMNGLGNIWTNAWSGNTAQFGNPLITECTLDISTSFRQAIWNDSFRAIARFQAIIDDENPENFPNYIAIAKIMKAFFMENMVDLYGDVPYSEAFKGQDGLTPKYDKDVDVYTGLVDEIFEALDLIDDAANSADPSLFTVAASSDVIYGGDMDEWVKFANTTLLKYAIHLSETTNSDGIALRNSIISYLSDPSNNVTYIDADATINPGYNNGADSKQNPLYNNFGRGTASGTINVQGYQLMTGSKHIIDNLLGDDPKTSGIYDSRIEEMFVPADIYNGNDAPVASGYDGFTQGDTNNDFKQDRGFPTTDQNPSNANVSLLGGIFFSFPDGAATDGYLIMLSEAEFLQSEAALRGYAGFSGAQAHFDAGVQASLIFMICPLRELII